MSAPFGDDEVDIDTQELATAAYNNAIALLSDRHDPTAVAMPTEPPALRNPFDV